MGDSEVDESNKDSLTSMTSLFEDVCPFFMSIGMSYTQFWDDDCWIASYYLKAYKIKKEQLNEQYWLQGMYFYEAILDASPVLHAFSKKGTKPAPYPSKPYEIYKKDKLREKIDSKKIKEQEQLKAKLYFEQWAKATAKKFKK